YEACCRHQLTPAIHFFSEGGGVNPAPTPAGYPGSSAESRTSRFTVYLAHLASLIYEGLFETLADRRGPHRVQCRGGGHVPAPDHAGRPPHAQTAARPPHRRCLWASL